MSQAIVHPYGPLWRGQMQEASTRAFAHFSTEELRSADLPRPRKDPPHVVALLEEYIAGPNAQKQPVNNPILRAHLLSVLGMGEEAPAFYVKPVYAKDTEACVYERLAALRAILPLGHGVDLPFPSVVLAAAPDTSSFDALMLVAPAVAGRARTLDAIVRERGETLALLRRARRAVARVILSAWWLLGMVDVYQRDSVQVNFSVIEDEPQAPVLTPRGLYSPGLPFTVTTYDFGNVGRFGDAGGRRRRRGEPKAQLALVPADDVRRALGFSESEWGALVRDFERSGDLGENDWQGVPWG